MISDVLFCPISTQKKTEEEKKEKKEVFSAVNKHLFSLCVLLIK